MAKIAYTQRVGLYLLASVAINSALASCTSTTQPEPAPYTKQTTGTLKNDNYSSFDEASEVLKKSLNEHGYDTSQGDLPVGTVESFVASKPGDSSADIRVNTSWKENKPLGSYAVLDDFEDSKGQASILGIVRLDASGVWIDCKGFQFELLSTDTKNTIPQLLASIRDQMKC